MSFQVDLRMERAEAAMALVLSEIERATRKHGPFNSTHEGYAVTLEELDEVWDEVRADKPQNAAHEAIQVAAMAIRFMVDIGSWEHDPQRGWVLAPSENTLEAEALRDSAGSSAGLL